jgi:pyridoxamine 5'-phosphate oxidase
MTDPAQLRRRYARDHLDEQSVGATWLEQFRRWFDAAVADPTVIEPNAMALATADAHGRPSVRTVLAKEFSERGVVFYTNYGSAKAEDLATNPYAAAAFAWLAHERQVRLSGPVRKVRREQTEAYFATRPRESQLGAWASAQSEVVASRSELEAALDEVSRRFEDGPIPAPPNWGGYLLEPLAVEFWQGRPGRLHDRLRFRRAGTDDDAWTLERLAP